jgi:anti-sigma regulatory factor (Ser/Thr protein kinase)/putative methionine-R-sulfoxide reductase with GAF domain
MPTRRNGLSGLTESARPDSRGAATNGYQPGVRESEHLRPVAKRQLGVGQVALELNESVRAPADQVRDLVRLSDPALSELEFERLLDELLVRVRDLLGVDTAAILLLDEERQQLVARAAKGIEEEVEQGVRIPIGRGFAGRIASQRVAIFIADVDQADIMNPILREKGIRSLLGIPLIVEGQLIGVLHIGSLRPRRFDLRDLAVLELAAARAAPAIERGRLLDELEREHRNAVILQRSLLPRRLRTVAGVTVAARYLPARDEVGGDWYDMIELPGGEIGIAIGDVVGHGLAAATLMGQLRTALRAFTLDGNGPGRTLELLDRFAVMLDEEAMATAAYALVDSDNRTVRFASAGHLPPICLSTDGQARAVEVAVAPPIGAFGYKVCPEHELRLDVGETMLLYTDGLIERPRVPLPHSIEELVAAVAGARTPEDACLTAMDRLVPPRGPRDDVAVIAVRNDPVPAVLELELPGSSAMLAPLRRTLARWLGEQDLDGEVASEITIAVTEAAANAVEHAYGPSRGKFKVHAENTDGGIEVRVSDQGRWRSPRGQNRGRGLRIIKAAMTSLDVRTDHDGTEIIMRRKLERA